MDDGLISFEVTQLGEGTVRRIANYTIMLTHSKVVTKVLNSGKLGQTKGVNLPNAIVDLPAVTEKDKVFLFVFTTVLCPSAIVINQRDIAFGVEQKVDMIAASFIRRADNITEIRYVSS